MGRLSFTVVAGSCLLAGCALASSSESTGGEIVPECVAHRGYWGAAVPENTVEGIRRAYAAGAMWVETDFHVMGDGAVQCFHDPKTRDRVIVPPYRVPTLEEVLAVVPRDRGIQAEIKTYGPTYAEKFDRAVKAAGLTETNVIVSSFNRAALADFKRRKPAYRALLLGVSGPQGLDAALEYARTNRVFAICPSVRQAMAAGFTRADADRVRAAGFSFRLYGVNDAAQLKYVFEVGAEAFTCNSYDWAFETAAAMGRQLKPKQPKSLDLAGIFPPEIRTVGIVMPASILNRAKFDRVYAALQAAGYRLKLAPRMNFQQVAPAADRARDFEEMWLDPEVDLVMCARGGTGAEDILPLLNWEKLRGRRQRVLGFSNITMILNAMLKEKAGIPISGPTLSQLAYSIMPTHDWLSQCLAQRPSGQVRLRALRPGAAQGTSAGGHLALVAKGVAQGWAPDTRGKILFIECVRRTPEQIRGYLRGLSERGYFEHAAAVVFGDLAPSDGKTQRLKGPEAKSILRELEALKAEFAAQAKCPVYDGYPYGHVGRSYAIGFTRECSISAAGILQFH